VQRLSGPGEGEEAAILEALRAAGLPPAAAEALLGQSEWPALLASAAGPAVRRSLPPARIAAELLGRRRCGVCGHPLHWSAAPLLVTVGGRPRRVSGVPHVAACSCGYAGPALDPAWLGALERHFAAHPGAAAADGDAVWP
jgi:hypothetical protein